MDDLLKEAIADAKAVRETALANAKMALEEAFTPKLKSMLAQKIQQEIEDEEEVADEVADAEEIEDEEEGYANSEEGEEDKEEMSHEVEDKDEEEDAEEMSHEDSEEEYEIIVSKLKDISNTISVQNIRCKEDFRDTQKPGWKFSEYEVKGVPIRIVMGPRDLENQTVEVFRRDILKKETIEIKDLVDFVLKTLNEIQINLLERAKVFNKENTFLVDDFDDFKEKINSGGFILAHWDGTSETENAIKKITKATIRCVPIDSKKESGKCVFSGQKSSQRVVFAKSY